MFTGIITDIGRVTQRRNVGGNATFRIATGYDLSTVAIGASIACDGVCMTVEETGADWFRVTASAETLGITTAGAWAEGRPLNLERALRVGDELGGHWVSGHVDGVGHIASIAEQGGSWQMAIQTPAPLLPFIAPKGSIALDGISLTVNALSADAFRVTIIPHSWTHTTLQGKQPGDAVNLEIDPLARYIARQMEGSRV